MGKSIAESPLGQMIVRLQAKLAEIKRIHMLEQQESESSLEKAYAKEQITAVSTVLDTIQQEILPKFDNEEVPGKSDFVSIYLKVKSLKNLLKTFTSPRFATWGVIEKDLATLIDNSLSKLKKPHTPAAFKEALKAGIRKLDFAAIEEIPRNGLAKLLEEIDTLIDDFNIDDFFKKDTKKQLQENLPEVIKKWFIGDRKPLMFKVTHPMTYELMAEMMVLIEQAPPLLDDLIPFLNPEAFTLDFTGGFTGAVLPSSLQIKVEHKPINDGSKHNYEVTKPPKPPRSFNVGDFYSKHFSRLKEALSAGLSAYFEEYDTTAHVQSERAKTSSIKAFIVNERAWCKSTLVDHAEKCKKLLRQNITPQMDHEEKLNLLKESIGTIDVLMAEAKDLSKLAQQRGDEYTQHSFASLVQSHSGIVQYLKGVKEKNPEATWDELPLPDAIVAEKPEGFAVVHVKKNLNDSLVALGKGLQESVGDLVSQRAKFTQQYKEVVQQWRGQEIEHHEARNKEFLEHLKVLTSKLASHKDLPIDESTELEVQIQVILKQLAGLEQQKELLSSSQVQLTTLQKQLEGPIECPARLVQEDQGIVKTLSDCYQTSKESTFRCEKQIKAAEQSLNEKKERLTEQLRKLEVAKQFAETMKTANPEAIAKLSLEKKEQLIQVKAKKEETTQRLELNQTNIQDKKFQFLESDPLRNRDPFDDQIRARDIAARELATKVDSVKIGILKITNDEISQIFSLQNLQTHQGTESAINWLKLLIDTNEQSLNLVDKVKEELSANENLLNALIPAFNLINDAIEHMDKDKIKFPFAQLDKLPGLRGLANTSTQKTPGLEILLKLLSFEAAEQTKWNKYRNASKNDVNLIADAFLLRELLKNKITIVKDKVQEVQSKLQVNADYERVRDVLFKSQSLLASLALLNKSIEEQQAIRTNLKREWQRLDTEIKQDKELLQELREEELSLTANINILETISELLAGNQQLNTLIETLEHSTEEFNTIDLVYDNKANIEERAKSANNALGELEGTLDILKQTVAPLANNSAYLANIKTIESLLTTAHHRIAKFKEMLLTKKIEDIEAQTKLSQEKINTIAQLLSQPSDNKLSLLSRLLTDYNQFRVAMYPHRQRVELVRADLESIISEEPGEKLGIAIKNLEILNLNAKELQDELLERIKLLLQGYIDEVKQQAQTLTALRLSESKASYESHKDTLSLVANYLTAFPQEQVANLKDSLEKLTPASQEALQTLEQVNAQYAFLKKQVEENKVINEGQKERLDLREQLSTDFKMKFDSYIGERKAKYAVKDSITRGDWDAREKFLNELREKITEYVSSGDSKPVLDHIKAQKVFPGLKLQPIINRLVLGLQEQDKKIPKDYYANIPEEIAPEHQDALQALEIFKKANSNFAKGIEALYTAIDKLRQHGQELTNEKNEHGDTPIRLATELQTKVDSFIISRKNIGVDKKSFEHFQADFIYHVHSQDDVMSNGSSSWESFWKPFIVNVTAALLTVGIAVGLYVGGTKLLTGRASFFAEKTERLNRVDSIDDALWNIEAPISVIG